jgi:hypothetical protein
VIEDIDYEDWRFVDDDVRVQFTACDAAREEAKELARIAWEESRWRYEQCANALNTAMALKMMEVPMEDEPGYSTDDSAWCEEPTECCRMKTGLKW